ncbi:MAG: hypothetical protein NC548_24745 [Lachnospiraceae bacterium]|nr:hypothetical protein [Lachnospiraceae bacterium]
MKHLDYLYGPWESIEQMYEDLQVTYEEIPIGLTIGIIEDEQIVEYWNPTTESGFIKKTSSGVEEIRVTGVEVGGYTSGDVIEKGTSLEDVLKKIMSKELYPIGEKTYPTCSLIFNPTNFESDVICKSNERIDYFFEVGAEITETWDMSYQDGVICTFEKYKDEDEKYNSINKFGDDENLIELKSHHVFADCEFGEKVFDSNMTTGVVEEQEYYIKGQISYSENKRIPQTNYGKELIHSEYPEYNIGSGVAHAPFITLKGTYKYWFLVDGQDMIIDKGDGINIDQINNFDPYWFDSNDVFEKIEIDKNQCIYFILPDNYKLVYDSNSASNINAVEGGVYNHVLPNGDYKTYNMWYMMNKGVYKNIRFVLRDGSSLTSHSS